jgi:hypothetical protein
VEVVVFGRTPAKLRTFSEQFGLVTTTDIDEIYGDRAVDLKQAATPLEDAIASNEDPHA